MKTPRDIALIHFTASPVVGGVEHVMNQHATLMHQAGHKVRVIAARGAQVHENIPFLQIHLADSMQPDILELKSDLDKGVVPPRFEEVKSLILKELELVLEGADTIIAHNICSLIKNLALTAAVKDYVTKHPNVRLISWQHDLAFAVERYADEIHEGYPWNLVSTPWEGTQQSFVAVSEKTKQEVREVFGLTPDKIEVISSGVDEQSFLSSSAQTKELLEACNITSQNSILLLPVRITRRKNIELALHITSEILKRYPQMALVVTGPPGAHNTSNNDYFDSLLALRQQLGLTPQDNGAGAHFLYEKSQGFLPDNVIAELYRLADGLLMTSLDEGLGIPVIEAGFCRLPVFCSDIPTFREICGNDTENCTFFSLNDKYDNIAARICDTLDTNRQFQLRKRVREKFSWDEIYRKQIAPLLET